MRSCPSFASPMFAFWPAFQSGRFWCQSTSIYRLMEASTIYSSPCIYSSLDIRFLANPLSLSPIEITSYLLPLLHVQCNSSQGAINLFPSTPSGKASSPRCVVCAHLTQVKPNPSHNPKEKNGEQTHGFNPFSLLIVAAKHPLHPLLGYAPTTASIVSLCTKCGFSPMLSKIVASCTSAPIRVILPTYPKTHGQPTPPPPAARAQTRGGKMKGKINAPTSPKS